MKTKAITVTLSSFPLSGPGSEWADWPAERRPRYTISPMPDAGGYRLKMLIDDEEEGGGVFPIEAYADLEIEDEQKRLEAALLDAWQDAQDTGSGWLSSL